MQSETMKGKVVLVTGATSGIGKVSAITLAGMGATVVVLGRNMGKGEELIREIEQRTGSKRVDFIVSDLASLDSVRSAALAFNSRYDRLDVLLDNAGGINGKRMVTKDGFEYTFGVNHLAHFVLTHHVLGKLEASAPSRVVVTSSAAYLNGHIDFEDLMGERKYRSFKSYGQSKLANVLFIFELARRLDGTKVTANCFHPGVVRTNFGKGLKGVGGAIYPLLGIFMISAEKGSETQIYLASSPQVEGMTGKYFAKKKAKGTTSDSKDEALASRLWEVSEELTRKWLA
jgi:NAD(P)-dependent dehydrogenase (short-subunit alcohol dehydrogenase family)